MTIAFPVTGEFQKSALPAYKRLAAALIVDALKSVSKGGSGKEFLCRETIWHELISLDPEKIRRLLLGDPEELRVSIKHLENVYGPNKKGSPGNPSSLIPFGKKGNTRHGATKPRPSKRT
tara:strand:+ start:649 stop:1008 length:360 start_codon:yes stop_codon:yes gene_type:complete